jgi:hypothetical protein
MSKPIKFSPEMIEQLEKAAQALDFDSVEQLIISALDMYLYQTGAARQIGWDPQK